MKPTESHNNMENTETPQNQPNTTPVGVGSNGLLYALRRAEKTMKDRAYADYERYNPLDYDKCLIWVEATMREVRKEIEEASNAEITGSPKASPG